MASVRYERFFLGEKHERFIFVSFQPVKRAALRDFNASSAEVLGEVRESYCIFFPCLKFYK